MPSFRNLAFLLLAVIPHFPARAQFLWETMEVNHHATIDETHFVASYSFRNGGSYPVTVREVRSSCGCTTVNFALKTYQPGEQGTLRVDFPFGDRSGRQHKVITIKTDDPKAGSTALALNVEIPQLLEISPRFVFWEEGKPAEPKQVHLKVNPQYGAKVKGVEVDRTRWDVALSTEKEGYILEIKPKQDQKSLESRIVIVTDLPASSPRQYTIIARQGKAGVPATQPTVTVFPQEVIWTPQSAAAPHMVHLAASKGYEITSLEAKPSDNRFTLIDRPLIPRPIQLFTIKVAPNSGKLEATLSVVATVRAKTPTTATSQPAASPAGAQKEEEIEIKIPLRVLAQ